MPLPGFRLCSEGEGFTGRIPAITHLTHRAVMRVGLGLHQPFLSVPFAQGWHRSLTLSGLTRALTLTLQKERDRCRAVPHFFSH